MSFSNQVIKPLRYNKPHIVKLDGLWRVSPYAHKKLWRLNIGNLWIEAHAYANLFNRFIQAEQEAAKERQREWKRKEKEIERVTMHILGKNKDPAPGIDWFCNRAWTVNEVRQLVREAIEPLLKEV